MPSVCGFGRADCMENPSAQDMASANTHHDANDDASVHEKVQVLGERESIWFKLSWLTRADDPIQTLKRFADKLGGCIPVTLKDERIFFLSEVEHFKHVLVNKADDYVKYFDGLTPIFGKAMITHDGALWQKIRMPQQPAFQPKMFGEYLPYLLSSVEDKARDIERYAAIGETFNLLEETWGLAASMVCKALFDRDIPFNPHAVFSAVKAYTDVANHREIRVKKVKGELREVSMDEALAGVVASWLTIPPAILGAVPANHRELTLLTLLQDAAADPKRPEFDEQQVLDEIKQYLWAGTETTALTLNWCFYLLHLNPQAAERIREESLGGLRRPRAHLRRYSLAVLHARRHPGDHAALSAGVEHHSGRKQRGRDCGPQDTSPAIRSCCVPISCIIRERYWNEPEKFDPSRFTPENMKKRGTYTYLPFSAGKRACIGGALSIFENTLALSQLLRRFRLEYVGDVPARMAATVTLTPQGGGLPFRAHLR